MTSTDRDRRETKRSPTMGWAFFDRDGVVEALKIKDYSDTGLGVYSRRECPPGQQGMVAIRLAQDKVRRYFSQIMWCKPNSGSKSEEYPFCLGLKIII